MVVSELCSTPFPCQMVMDFLQTTLGGPLLTKQCQRGASSILKFPSKDCVDSTGHASR